MYTLVLVDMQPYFSAANSRRVRDNCKREIEKAMERRAAIIFVEFNNCGPTVKSLIKMTDDYDRRFFAYKDMDDGSAEVAEVIHNNKLANKKLKVCGVNTDCCVRSTVQGLSSRLPKADIQVIGNACNTVGNHLYGLNAMKNLPNVKVK